MKKAPVVHFNLASLQFVHWNVEILQTETEYTNISETVFMNIQIITSAASFELLVDLCSELVFQSSFWRPCLLLVHTCDSVSEASQGPQSAGAWWPQYVPAL